MCCVFVFGAQRHPDSLGPPPDDPEDSEWTPFDFLIYRCGRVGCAGGPCRVKGLVVCCVVIRGGNSVTPGGCSVTRRGAVSSQSTCDC
jgi:hypothetical protein